MDLFTTYRKMFATTNPDELVVWWYCGFVVAPRDGVGPIPLAQAETIMVYRTRTVDAATFTIDWTEVGVFRDITTGEIMDGWFNPFDGIVAPHPKSFVDGPATFTVSRRDGGMGTAGINANGVDPDGIDIALVQHNARVDGVVLDVRHNPTTTGLRQTETKTRTFHRPDGTLPPIDGPDATHIDTVLSIWSPQSEIDDPAVGNATGRGFYTSGSSSVAGAENGGGSWASTSVQGALQKASVHERLNPVAWDRLKRLYPDFFDGDRIAPRFA